MELRYRLALVTAGGGASGREVAVCLARAGVGVLIADPDHAAATETSRLVRERRVWSATVQIDTMLEDDVRLLAARVRDLGCVSLVLDVAGGPHCTILREQLDDSVRWVDAETLAASSADTVIRQLRAA